MSQTCKKKLIEVAIPLEAINAAPAREKSIRHGHPSTRHPAKGAAGDVWEDRPRLHPVPRMQKATVTVTEMVNHPGQRTHWGFLASDVKKAFDTVGMDFGGYVRSEDGIEHLRPDQLVPVLWKAVQELAAEVAVLKAAMP